MDLPHVDQHHRNHGADNDADGDYGDHEFYSTPPLKGIVSHEGVGILSQGQGFMRSDQVARF
jgi:hypothetical protein